MTPQIGDGRWDGALGVGDVVAETSQDGCQSQSQYDDGCFVHWCFEAEILEFWILFLWIWIWTEGGIYAIFLDINILIKKN